MDTVLQGLPGIVCYLDDIIVMGKGKAEHLCNLERVLRKWLSCMCFFMQDSVEYLDHTVDKHGIQMSPKKVKAIAEMP